MVWLVVHEPELRVRGLLLIVRLLAHVHGCVAEVVSSDLKGEILRWLRDLVAGLGVDLAQAVSRSISRAARLSSLLSFMPIHLAHS